MRGLAELPGVTDVSVDGVDVTASVTNCDALLARLSEVGIESLSVSPPTLESLFLHYYDRSAAGEDAR